MNKKTENVYLFNFTDQELPELYEALILQDEIKHRLAPEGETVSESQVLKKVAKEFSDRSSHRIRQGALEMLDDYVDGEIDEEIMWQGIEEQLRKKSEEK